MDLLIKRLKNLGLTDIPACKSKNLDAYFCQWEEQQTPLFYRRLVDQNHVISLEYSVLKSQLTSELKSAVNKESIAHQLMFVFILAQLLEYINYFYLKTPKEVRRFRQDQDCYLSWLKKWDYGWEEPEKKKKLKGGKLAVSSKIRELTSTVNWPRLLLIRIKRVLDVLTTVIESNKAFTRFVFIMDKFSNPVLPYLAWAFYVPRLMTNLFLCFKHVFPGFWMSEEEKSLGWAFRLKTQLKRRWFELANDSVWLTIGVINCFILVGALAPVAAYLTVALYTFDVLLAGIRAYIEMSRLKHLKSQYAEIIKATASEDQHEIKAYQASLNARIKYERLRLGLSVATTSSLLLTMCLTLPFFAAINPVIPLIGVILVVAVSIVSYALGKYFERYKPDDKISAFKKSKEVGRVSQKGIFARSPKHQPLLRSHSENDLKTEKDIEVRWGME
ncbi:hypothetical protein E3983_00155 [Legionella israelensis]|uniref:Coiled-coil protein n=1 Tax=Legionella israelensis TaxID=454 RepID=A0AAX1ED03_9GAMM|nr:hypothetical protein [Legionella israelensis]QBR82909.1 hypothetical protein E3983_00155 [Legionella israelensis]